MKKSIILFLVFVALNLIAANLSAQTDTIFNVKKTERASNNQVRQAIEIESLVPMFFTGGYHYALCYRYHQFRIRASVINGGHYDAEPAGVKNATADFKRYYKTSPGVFVGYNVWKNLELYSYLEMHTFAIEEKSSGIQKDIHSTDIGAGISYQFFIGRYFYIQPGMHLYLRSHHSLDFNGKSYTIPNTDIAPVIRFGARLWRKY